MPLSPFGVYFLKKSCRATYMPALSFLLRRDQLLHKIHLFSVSLFKTDFKSEEQLSALQRHFNEKHQW